MATRGPDAVVFDVGGVFVLPSPAVLRAALGAEGVVVAADDGAFHRAHYRATAALDGAARAGVARADRWLVYLGTYLEEIGVAPDRLGPDRFAELWHRPAIELWSWVQVEAAAALRRLVTFGMPVAVVSNADGTVERSLRERGVLQVGPGAGAEVLTVVDSAVVGAEKPDPATFAPALAVLAERGVEPARCWYVGDTWAADVVGARAAGMEPVHLDPYGLYAADGHRRVGSVAEVVADVLGEVGPG